MKLKPGETIIDEDLFVHAHLCMIDGSCSEKVKKPYRDRLERYKRLKQQCNQKL